MTDTIIKGSGNSRKLISVPNLATLAPTHEDLIRLLAEEGLPVDLSGPLAEGCDVIGTPLDKANLLSATAENAIFGTVDDRTVNEALIQLSKCAYSESGSVSPVSSVVTINFSFPWKFLVCFSSNYPVYYITVAIRNYSQILRISQSSTSHSGTTLSGTFTDYSASFSSGYAIYYAAFG